MHKAMVRANEYFWDNLAKKIKRTTPHEILRKQKYENAGWQLDGSKYLYIASMDNFPSHCMYENNLESSNKMTQKVFNHAVQFAYENHMIPVFLGNPIEFLKGAPLQKVHVIIDKIENCHLIKENEVTRIIPIISVGSQFQESIESIVQDTVILRVTAKTIKQLFLSFKMLANMECIRSYWCSVFGTE